MSSLQQAYQGPVLAEEFIDGREFYVGVLGNSEVKALPVMELDFTGYPADRREGWYRLSGAGQPHTRACQCQVVSLMQSHRRNR